MTLADHFASSEHRRDHRSIIQTVDTPRAQPLLFVDESPI
jgi:hypothetical protein